MAPPKIRNANEQKLTREIDRKSTRQNSSHTVISYAVFCLKKKKQKRERNTTGVFGVGVLGKPEPKKFPHAHADPLPRDSADVEDGPQATEQQWVTKQDDAQ